MIKTNPDQSVTKTYFRQDDVQYSGCVAKEERYGSDGELYKRTEYAYGKRTLVNNHRFAGVLKVRYHDIYRIDMTDEYTSIYNGEGGEPETSRTEYCEYDDYGNPVRVKYHGNTGTREEYAFDDEETVTAYAMNPETYVIVPVSVVKRSYTLDNTWEVSSETRYLYDGLDYGRLTKGLVTGQELYNEDEVIRLSCEYDEWGNPVRTKDGRATAGEYGGYTSEITYDTDYRIYPRFTKNAAGHVTETRYDNLMRPAEVIDPNGANTRTGYDRFGRVNLTCAPGDDITSPTVITEYGDTASPRYVKVSQKGKDGYYHESCTFFDGQGRVLKEKKEHESGWATVTYYYDDAGRQVKKTMPYKTTTPGYVEPAQIIDYMHYEYDPVGRFMKVINPDNTCTTFEYGKADVATINPLRHKTDEELRGKTIYQHAYKGTYESGNRSSAILYSTTTIEKRGNGTKVIDPCSTQLNPDCKIRCGGNCSITLVDRLGRKLSYTDPDTGTHTYTYDPNGNLTSQTDAEGKTISFTYDCLNRPTGKYYGTAGAGNLKTAYFYDEEGHGCAKGKLTRLVMYAEPGSSDVLYAESYVYD